MFLQGHHVSLGSAGMRHATLGGGRYALCTVPDTGPSRTSNRVLPPTEPLPFPGSSQAMRQASTSTTTINN
eukprot:scaffold110938_cov54-Phaeocystis_antarctica.AAC.3